MAKRFPREEWVGCIDPPGPWAALRDLREFLASLDQLPDGDLVQSLREEIGEYIRHAEADPMRREPGDLN